MKFVRVATITLAIVMAGLLVLVGVAFNRTAQTWAVKRILRDRPGWGMSVGSVSVGLDEVRLDDVQIRRRGAVFTLPIVQAELPPISAGLNRRVFIRRLVATGWTLDLTKAERTVFDRAVVQGFASAQSGGFALIPNAEADSPAATGAVQAFSGIFQQLRLPVDASLDGVELEGDVLLPPAPGTRGTIRAHVLFGGGGLSAGSEGHFTFNVTVSLPQPDAPVNALTMEGSLSATMGTPRSFNKAAVRINAAAKGNKFPNGVRLAADLSAARGSYGESYTATLAGDSKELASLQGEYSDSTHRLEGRWKLDVVDDDLSPFALGRVLPLFDAVGSGRFETDATLAQTRVSGGLTVTADRLTALRPELSPIGAVKVTADFDLTHRGGLLRIDRLRASVAGARPILTIQGLQPFAFNVDTGELQVADSAHDLVGLTLQGVPIEWAEPFLPELLLTGDPIRGEFTASASEGGLSLRSKAPLALSALTATRDGQVLVRDAAISLGAEADYTPKGWQVNLNGKATGTKPEFRADGTAVSAPVTFEVKVGRLAGSAEATKATGTLDADLAAVLARSSYRDSVALTQGHLSGGFIASLGAQRTIQVNFDVTNLIAGPNSAAGELPDVSGSVQADFQPHDRIAFTAPVVFVRAGNKSDLTLAGTFVKTNGGMALLGQAASTRLVAADLKVLGALLEVHRPAVPASPAVAPPAALAAVAAPTAPFWGPIMGKVQLALKEVDFSGCQATDVSGTLRTDGSSLKGEGLRAVLEPGGDVQMDATLTFAVNPTPYTLQAQVEVNNFDPAPIFEVLKPGQAPTVEGKFNLRAQLTGQGTSLADLAQRIRGDGEITSKGGVFRMLSTDITPKAQSSGKVAAIESFLGGLANAVTRHKDAASKAQAVLDLAKMIAPIQFDQLSIGITRDANLNTQLKDFALISPEMRLGGNGKITYQEGTPILDQPFAMKLKLSARGHTGDLLKSAGMLDSSHDEFGYAACTLPITLGGTLGKPDTSDLQTALLKTAYEKSGASDWLGKLIP